MFAHIGEQKNSKCFITQGSLPKNCEFEQPPSKNKPFSTILAKPFLHKVDLLVPAALHENESKIIEKIGTVEYQRVILRLSDILSGDFFNVYIKKGNVSLLSEGRPGVDPIYSLHEGQLRLELPKQLYETAGLVGKPIEDSGRKHIKSRFGEFPLLQTYYYKEKLTTKAIEYDLRLASMVRGRKGFDRLFWASRNALDQSLTWLFLDYEGNAKDPGSPLAAHHPHTVIVKLSVQKHRLRVPSLDILDLRDDEALQEEALAILEWLDLVTMSSPRVETADTIDPFLSRYTIPDTGRPEEQDVVCLSWRGFLPSTWVRSLLMRYLNAAAKEPNYWFSLSGHCLWPKGMDFKSGWTVLRAPLRSTAMPMSGEGVGRAHMDVSGDREMATTDDGPVRGQSDKEREASTPRYVLFEMRPG